MLNFEKNKNKSEIKDDAFYVTRHGVAEYKLNERIVASDNPQHGHEAQNQDFLQDLTPEGRRVAHEKAEDFFNSLNSETDALFFVSSNLVRAAETAQIYKEVAKERGFEIIKPENVRDEIVQEIGEGDIRNVESLSVHIKNMLLEFIFHPHRDYLNEVVQDKSKLPQDILDKWGEARKVIESDNQGTWGNNFYKHSEQISKIFPDIRSAEQVYNQEFKDIIRLMKFGQKKIAEKGYSKNIKVLAFSHENAFLYFLGKNFQECALDNCESIAFSVDDSGIIETKAKNKNMKLDL